MADNYDGQKLVEQIHRMEHGKARTDMIKDAIIQADKAGDNYWRMYMRFDYISEQYFHGDPVKSIPVITELENVFKEDPGAVERYEGDGLGKEAYVMAVLLGVDTILCLPQVTTEQWEKLLDNLYKLVKQFGMAERSYYWQMFWRWLYADFNKAEEYLKKAWNTEPDYRFDCESCEHAYAARLYLEIGQKEKADKYFEKVDKGLLDDVCDDTYPQLWYTYLKYMLDNGDIKGAKPFAKKLYRKHNEDQGDLEFMGAVLRYYAYVNTTKGLSIFEKRLEWTINMWNQKAKYYFYMGAYVLFREISKKQTDVRMELPVKSEVWREDGIYNTSVLADWFYTQASGIAESFDKRNSNDYYTKHLEIA